MAPGDGWTSRLIAGLAQQLENAGVGTYRATGAYQPGEIAILDRAIPDKPDRIITLSAYPVGSSMPGLADHQTAVQIRVRGTQDPRVCDDLADAVFDVLDGAEGLDLGGVHVVQMWRQSYTSLGQDQHGRWERSENYYLDAMRPTSNNTD
jgi:hypothetical protein